MRTITLEEHYATPAFMEGPGRQIRDQARAAHDHPQVAAGYARLIDQLCDLDDRRIADMDAASIDVQVLSLTSPGVEQLDAAEATALAREANDHLAAAVRRHPGRLAGFAALPTSAPDAAAAELERTVRDHGFKGALINGHTRGRYLDNRFFWPILERAEALDVPLYQKSGLRAPAFRHGGESPVARKGYAPPLDRHMPAWYPIGMRTCDEHVFGGLRASAHAQPHVRGVAGSKPSRRTTCAVSLDASKYLGAMAPSSSRGHRASSSLAGWPEARSPLAFAMGSVTSIRRRPRSR